MANEVAVTAVVEEEEKEEEEVTVIERETAVVSVKKSVERFVVVMTIDQILAKAEDLF